MSEEPGIGDVLASCHVLMGRIISRDEVHRTLDVMKTGFATFPKSAARAGRSEGMRVPLSCVRLYRIGKKKEVCD